MERSNIDHATLRIFWIQLTAQALEVSRGSEAHTRMTISLSRLVHRPPYEISTEKAWNVNLRRRIRPLLWHMISCALTSGRSCTRKASSSLSFGRRSTNNHSRRGKCPPRQSESSVQSATCSESFEMFYESSTCCRALYGYRSAGHAHAQASNRWCVENIFTKPSEQVAAPINVFLYWH